MVRWRGRGWMARTQGQGEVGGGCALAPAGLRLRSCASVASYWQVWGTAQWPSCWGQQGWWRWGLWVTWLWHRLWGSLEGNDLVALGGCWCRRDLDLVKNCANTRPIQGAPHLSPLPQYQLGLAPTPMQPSKDKLFSWWMDGCKNTNKLERPRQWAGVCRYVSLTFRAEKLLVLFLLMWNVYICIISAFLCLSYINHFIQKTMRHWVALCHMETTATLCIGA